MYYRRILIEVPVTRFVLDKIIIGIVAQMFLSYDRQLEIECFPFVSQV